MPYPARIASAAGRIAAKAAIGVVASVLTKATQRAVENVFYGTHHSLFENATETFVKGALVGAVMGKVGERGSAGKAGGAAGGSAWKSNLGKGLLKPGSKLAHWQAKEHNVKDHVLEGAKRYITTGSAGKAPPGMIMAGSRMPF